MLSAVQSSCLLWEPWRRELPALLRIKDDAGGNAEELATRVAYQRETLFFFSQSGRTRVFAPASLCVAAVHRCDESLPRLVAYFSPGRAF
jgi:hypothetical protein